jgi:hypothetical protein
VKQQYIWSDYILPFTLGLGTYMPGARKFDVGEKSTATILPGVIATLEQIKARGVENIAASLSTINSTIATHLEQLGFQLPNVSLRCPHMFGAQFPDGYTGNLVAELKKKNIYISQRGNAVRFAPHLHINENDLNCLTKALGELLE